MIKSEIGHSEIKQMMLSYDFNEETIQTWVNGGEVILKKVEREYAYRLANEAGDWIDGLPDGMVWADAQALFEDFL